MTSLRAFLTVSAIAVSTASGPMTASTEDIPKIGVLVAMTETKAMFDQPLADLHFVQLETGTRNYLASLPMDPADIPAPIQKTPETRSENRSAPV